ncbi:hypothetical protein L479_01546 [Exiguobacterium sp. S17]|nr:hypothetical protein L479_01546 [Exiguobacterium sp. S17]
MLEDLLEEIVGEIRDEFDRDMLTVIRGQRIMRNGYDSSSTLTLKRRKKKVHPFESDEPF